MNYPFINFPHELAHIMRVNVQLTLKDMNTVQKIISESPGLYSLVKRMSPSKGEDFILEREIKSHGWKSFLSRLSSMYVEKDVIGKFPLSPDVKILDEIERFEEKLEPYFISGYSRAYLLGLYYKFCLSSPQGKLMTAVNPLTTQDETFELLEAVHSRVFQIDFLYIILQHLAKFLGHVKVKKLLLGGVGFQEIYETLKDEQQEMLIQNLMTYGASVGDSEFFLPLNV